MKIWLELKTSNNSSNKFRLSSAHSAQHIRTIVPLDFHKSIIIDCNRKEVDLLSIDFSDILVLGSFWNVKLIHWITWSNASKGYDNQWP